MKSLVKKLCVLLMAFTMLASNVYASEQIDSLYPLSENVYTADFTDNEIDSNIVVTDTIGNQVVNGAETDIFDAYEDNGEFVMDCVDYVKDPGSYATISFYATKDHTPYKIPDGKNLVISFDITRHTSGSRQFMLGYNGHDGSKARSGPYFKWINNEDFSGKDGSSGDFTVANNGLSLQTDANTDNWHELVWVMDSSYVADLFIDGKLMRSGITMRESGSTMIEKFFISFESYRNRGQVVKLKNFKMYTATESVIGKDLLSLDVSDLTNEIVDSDGNYVIENNLTLPTSGENGSSITWASSDEKLIETNGTVHRVSGYSVSDAVTLTATLVNGEETAQKEFTFYVKRIDAESAPDMEGDYINYDDFSNSNLLYSDVGTNGTRTFENDKLIIKNTSSKEWTQYFAFTKDKKSLPQGTYVLEYDLTKSHKSMRSRYDIIGQFYGTNLASTRMFVRHEILNANRDNGILTQEIGTNTSAKQISSLPVLYTTDTVKVKYILNDVNNTYSLYIDGALLAKDAPYIKISSGYEQILSGYRFTIFGNGHSMTIDNLKLYKLADSAVETPEMSAKTIELDGENVAKLKNSGTYIAKLNVTDFTSSLSDKTDFVVAIYNKNTNELESVKFIDAKILQATVGVNTEAPTMENYGYYAKTTVEVPEDYENYCIKLMHWNDVTPLSGSETIR